MKIALIAVELSGKGGTETHILEWAKDLTESGHECVVVAGSSLMYDRAGQVSPVVKIKHEIPNKKLLNVIRDRYLRLPIRAYNIYKVIKDSDIVHIHSKGDLPSSVIAAKMAKKKVIYTCHGLIYKDSYVKPLKYRLWNKLVTWSLKNCDLVHCVSYSAKEGLVKAFGGGNVNSFKSQVLYLGSDLHPADRFYQKNLADSVIHIGICARLHKEKRFETILQSMSLLNAHGDKKYILNIYGSGSKASNRRMDQWVHKYNLHDSVMRYGWTDDRTAAILRNHIIIVPTTHDEAFALSKIEAWNHERPMICFSDAGGKECVIDGQNGILIDGEDYVTLAIRIMNLSTNHYLHRGLIINGKRTARMISSDHYKKNMIKNYEAVNGL